MIRIQTQAKLCGICSGQGNIGRDFLPPLLHIYIGDLWELGRPRQRGQEDVMEDLKELKVKNWKQAAKDRRTCREVAEKAKAHKGL